MKRLLLISYFWPPSGKASGHWPYRMAGHLQSLGWEPTILTVDEDTFSQSDPSYAAAEDAGYGVIRAPGMEPFGLYRKFLGKPADAPLQASEAISKTNTGLRHRASVWIRMNLFVPDARVGWYWTASRTVRRELAGSSFDAVLSVGPPHTGHLVGRKLSRFFSAPHIPVLIDPWTDIVYYRDFKRNPITRALDRSLERRVIEEASDVIFVTESMRADYISKYPSLGKRAHVLYWGYDETPFARLGDVPRSPERTLVHAGNIFDYQNPTALWKTIRTLNDSGSPLRIVFIGTVGPGIRRSISDEGLDGVTTYLGFLPYEQMLERLLSADYLMVCASEKRHVPGKLFEYLRSGKPILAFGNDNEEVEGILARTSAGMVRRFDDPADSFFREAGRFERNWEAVRSFDRKAIAAKLASILDSTAGQAS